MIAAASIDDVLAISCFTVLVGVAFNPGSDLARTALQGPLEVVAGLGYGLLLGILATFLIAFWDWIFPGKKSDEGTEK